MIAEEPVSIVPNPEVIDPEFNAPTEVSEDPTTPLPKAVGPKTSVPFIL